MSYQITHLFLRHAVLLKKNIKSVNLLDGTCGEIYELPTWYIVLSRQYKQDAKNHQYTIQ